MSAPLVPTPRRSAEEIDADIRQVRAERPLTSSPDWDPRVRAESLEREAELWREMGSVAAGTAFGLAVAVAECVAEDNAVSARRNAAAIASAQAAQNAALASRRGVR